MTTAAARYFLSKLEPIALPDDHLLMRKWYKYSRNEVDNYTKYRIILLEHMETLGRQIKDVRSDGNCMFSAIREIEKGNNLTTEKDYRKIAVLELRKNKKLYENFVDENFETYIARMSKSGEFGDNIMLQGIANAENKKFTIHQVDVNTKRVLSNTIQRNTTERESSTLNRAIVNIHLVYFSEQKHYMAAVLHPEQPREIPLVLTQRDISVLKFQELGIAVDDSITESDRSFYNSLATQCNWPSGNAIISDVTKLLAMCPDRYPNDCPDSKFRAIADCLGSDLVIYKIIDGKLSNNHYPRFTGRDADCPQKVIRLASYSGYYMPVTDITVN